MFKLIASSMLAMLIGACAYAQADEVTVESKANGYSIVLPKEWKDIPAEILEKQAARNRAAGRKPSPPEFALQREYKGIWFERPTLLVQVFESDRTRYSKLPTQQEFMEWVTIMASKRVLAPLSESVKDTPNADARRHIKELIDAMKSGTVTYDVAKRRFWSVTNVPATSEYVAHAVVIIGTFLPNGSLVQIFGAVNADEFEEGFAVFNRSAESIKAK